MAGAYFFSHDLRASASGGALHRRPSPVSVNGSAASALPHAPPPRRPFCDFARPCNREIGVGTVAPAMQLLGSNLPTSAPGQRPGGTDGTNGTAVFASFPRRFHQVFGEITAGQSAKACYASHTGTLLTRQGDKSIRGRGTGHSPRPYRGGGKLLRWHPCGCTPFVDRRAPLRACALQGSQRPTDPLRPPPLRVCGRSCAVPMLRAPSIGARVSGSRVFVWNYACNTLRAFP